MKSALQRAVFLGLLSAASAALALPVEPPGVLSAPHILSLDEAVDRALEQNPSLQASRAALSASEWASRKSWMAFLPTGSFSSSVTRVDDDTYNRANQAVSGMEQMFEALGITGVEIEPFLYRDTYRTSFTLNQQFPLNLNLIGQRGLASAGLRAGEAGHAASQSEIILAVRQAYFSVLATREMQDVARESVASAENRMALARDKAELGMLPRSDVLRWETTLAEAKSGELAASNGVRLAEMNLNRLLGQALDAPLSLERVNETSLGHALCLSEIDPESLAEGILNHSPTARAIQAGADAASAGKTLAMSGITPSLHFSLSKGWQDNDTMELDGDATSSMTALVTMPVFDLLGNYAAYRQASADKRRAEYESADALEHLRMGAWAAWLEVERSRQNLSFRESAERQARETFDEMESRYEAGQVAEFDLVDVQMGLTAARAQAVASRYEYFGALAALESLVGEPTMTEETK
jgi:outer membrane protein